MSRVQKIKISQYHSSDTDAFIEKARSIYGQEYDYSLAEYVNNTQKIKIICKLHGIFEQSPAVHLCRRGCKLCSLVASRAMAALTTAEFIERAIQVHGNIYDYSLVVYTKSSDNVKIICKRHGVFEQIPTHHWKGSGCPFCKNKSEGLLLNWLSEKYGGVQTQLTFSDGKYENSTKPFRYDFAFGNIIIELDGDQHFRQVANWAHPEITMARDIIKAKYAISQGYNLIRLYQPDVLYNTNDWETKLLDTIEKIKRAGCSGEVFYLSDKYDNHEKQLNDELVTAANEIIADLGDSDEDSSD